MLNSLTLYLMKFYKNEVFSMKIIEPRPFTFEAGKRAVLLLHAFTGDSADVRMLGRFLQGKNYTVHAPIYRGHEKAPEQLIETNPDMWWEDVLQGYDHLRKLGYTEIAVAGLSLGGALSLKLSYTKPLKGLVAMATPIFFNNEKRLTQAFKMFVTRYKQLRKKDQATIAREVELVMGKAPYTIRQLEPFLDDVRANLEKITLPTLIVQPQRDQLLGLDHAPYIYEHISSENKQLLWYEQSTHVVTVDKEKDRLHEDVFKFLESLNWSDSN